MIIEPPCSPAPSPLSVRPGTLTSFLMASPGSTSSSEGFVGMGQFRAERTPKGSEGQDFLEETNGSAG